MSAQNVDQIVVGQMDFTGKEILAVYGKVSRTFAVYGTDARVMVHFADNDVAGENGEPLGKQQRLALAPLHPIRGEINGLIDVWRRGSAHFFPAAKQARAARFDHSTADALLVALQGDQAQALSLLTVVRDDVREERTSIGRTEYLVVASLIAAVIVMISWFMSPGAPTGEDVAPKSPLWAFFDTGGLWLAIAVGAIGAFFSISLDIRSREIKTDLQRRDNIIDALLRIVIGSISAVVLFGLFRSNIVAIEFFDNRLDLGDTNTAIVIAFIAGFSERLVGDYLSKAVLSGKAATAAAAATASVHSAGDAGSNERNPLGQNADSGSKPVHANDDFLDHGEMHADGCLCDSGAVAEEITGDEELPEATGGVARAS